MFTINDLDVKLAINDLDVKLAINDLDVKLAINVKTRITNVQPARVESNY